MISSSTNSRVKDWIRLQKQAKYRKKEKAFIVEGIKLTDEAAKNGKLREIFVSESLFQSISMQDGQKNPLFTKAKQLLDTYPYEIVTDSVFEGIATTVTPQGMMGLADVPEYSVEQIISKTPHQFLILDDLRDPGNLGTLLRTALGAGMSGVILSTGCVDVFNPKVVRSTMGAIFRVPFCYVDDLPKEVCRLTQMGYEVYATAMEGSVVYDVPDYTKGAAVVIGNEANGISPEVFSRVTGRIRIPMEDGLESLNAAVSGAIVMYEMNRQRRLKNDDE